MAVEQIPVTYTRSLRGISSSHFAMLKRFAYLNVVIFMVLRFLPRVLSLTVFPLTPPLHTVRMGYRSLDYSALNTMVNVMGSGTGAVWVITTVWLVILTIMVAVVSITEFNHQGVGFWEC